jgi:hypothetical protein
MATTMRRKREAARKLKGEIGQRGRPKGAWTPEKVRERIRIGLIVLRLENQALGNLEKEQIVTRPLIRDGKLIYDENGKPATEVRLRSIAMTAAQLTAALTLVDRCLPKPQAPLEVALAGTIIVNVRDPTAENPHGTRRRRTA